MWRRAGLIGSTGFVGGNLAAQTPFAAAYNSRTIGTIAGETFDTVVCAGAPAAMWQANADPAADEANIRGLAEHLKSARIGRLILISTVAVFADTARGDTETDAVFETKKAYGRNRRMLELDLSSAFRTHVIRLPALFGPGLKKNFLFDLMSPVPSFLKPDRYAALLEGLSPRDRATVERVFDWNATLGMQALDRGRLAVDPDGGDLTRAVTEAGFAASGFTNSDSSFQYYNLARLKADIETAVKANLPTLNLVSEPWRAGDLHQALTSCPFVNDAAPLNREDVRTVHADAFGRSGSYLISADEVLIDLKTFFAEQAA